MNKKEELELLKKFTWDNIELIKSKHSSQNRSVDYKLVDYDKLHPLYGTCTRMSCFYINLKNPSWKWPYRMHQRYLPEKYNIPGCHTWNYNYETNEVVDISEDQLPDELRNREFYRDFKVYGSQLTSVRFNRMNKQMHAFPHQVPSQLTIMLGQKWKELTGSAEHIQYWIDRWDERFEYNKEIDNSMDMFKPHETPNLFTK